MRTLLVIAEQGGFGAAVQAVLSPAEFRLCVKNELDPNVFALNPSLVNCCLLDAELVDVAPIRLIERIRTHFTGVPILVYTSDKKREWEEEAYLSGATHVLTKPIRAHLLNHLLEQLNAAPAADAVAPTPVLPHQSPAGGANLEVVKQFSRLFQHGFSADEILKEVLLLIRDMFKVNRAAIFLRDASRPNEISFSVKSAAGIQPLALENIHLTSDKGIAKQILQTGRIITAAQASAEARRELAILGAQLAVPISDREQILGFAILDSQLAGDPLSREQLEILFHFLEALGMGLKSLQSHEAMRSQGNLFSEMLSELSCGCIVVDEKMLVLHCNAAAARIFLPSTAAATLKFKHLPQEIGSRVFNSLNSGTPEFFDFREEGSSALYFCRTTPFYRGTTKTVLLVLDDISHLEKVRRLEVETASLRLIKDMAVHLSHEIGNAIMPVITSQQLNRTSKEDDKLAKLNLAASSGLRRINRLTRQMQFLADDALGPVVPVSISDLLKEAVEEAQSHHQESPAVINNPAEEAAPLVPADKQKLVLALAEIILNGLQASPAGQPVQISWKLNGKDSGAKEVAVTIADRGSGFSTETAQRAAEPFFSTRTVGMGLGLTIANRVVQLHRGRLEFALGGDSTMGTVKITLPISRETSQEA